MRHRTTHILIAVTAQWCIFPFVSYGFERDGLKFQTPPHCGLYCVYAAAKYLGKDVNFVDLAKPEYVGRAEGSSLSELRQCVEDTGLKAEAIQNIDGRLLRASQWPIILHVKEDYGSKDFSHYVLFMHMEDGKAVVLDSSEMKRTPFNDLFPLMDGVGLVVSNEKNAIGSLIWARRGRMVGYTVLIFAAVTIARILFTPGRFRRAWHLLLSPAGTYIAQAVVVIAVGCMTAFLFHFIRDGGYLSHAKYTEPIISSHSQTFLHKIGKNKVERLLKEGAALIDARYYDDFRNGHIEGAISLPIDASEIQNKEVLSRLDKDRQIVVYCQSARCPYAKITALWLKENNCNNVSVYRGGWMDWIK